MRTIGKKDEKVSFVHDQTEKNVHKKTNTYVIKTLCQINLDVCLCSVQYELKNGIP